MIHVCCDNPENGRENTLADERLWQLGLPLVTLIKRTMVTCREGTFHYIDA
jgi:hypothetical protein